MASKDDRSQDVSATPILARASEAADQTPAANINKTDLQAWQDRCALVEGALAAANEVLQRELPSWQERCATAEASLAAANAQLQRELPEWERRCAVTEAALAAANERLADEIPRWRDRCELAEDALMSVRNLAERSFSSPITTDAFLAFASTFSPAQAVGFSKRRIGAETDGGYVMLDDMSRPCIVLSLGVGHDTSWDCKMADLEAVVHQYDHTVQPPAGQPPSIVFHSKRIVDVADGSGVTLAEALSTLDDGDTSRPAVLKLDIEGSEWSVLDAAPSRVLGRFDQIICEYHDLGEAVEPAWFERACRVVDKIQQQFQTVHVHGNNNGQIIGVGGVSFPSVLEVTYANRARYSFQPTTERFPTGLDRPNNNKRPDLWLGSFSF